ncbi:MAG: prepilin-type N-terminal cleavage/methylation domain-containing protein [Myxococcaceae bacterium]
MTRAGRGFTIIELAVVMSIGVILAALAYTGFESTTTIGRVNGEVEVIAQFMRLARLRAVSTGCAHTVRVRGQNFVEANQMPGRVLLIRERGCLVTGANSANLVLQPNDEIVNEYKLEPRVRIFTDGHGDIRNLSLLFGYDPDGTFIQGVETSPGVSVIPDPAPSTALTSVGGGLADGGAAGATRSLGISGGGHVTFGH